MSDDERRKRLRLKGWVAPYWYEGWTAQNGVANPVEQPAPLSPGQFGGSGGGETGGGDGGGGGSL